MQRIMLKSKIHNAVVTEADLSYMGSITIDETLMEAADLYENERVQVVNLNNGSRFETYVICGERDSGVICLNGPAARCALVGDVVHILGYGLMGDEEIRGYSPRIVILGEKNAIARSK